MVSEDGSGKGAAMVAAVAQRLGLMSHLLEDSEGEDDDQDEDDDEDSWWDRLVGLGRGREGGAGWGSVDLFIWNLF